jgi:prepilin-type processing-associated H-X9-DG protein/prepilin-type N-terminal cleavage/methylation domain-containing protein
MIKISFRVPSSLSSILYLLSSILALRLMTMTAILIACAPALFLLTFNRMKNSPERHFLTTALNKTQTAAFTLIELIAVIAVLALAAGLILPALRSSCDQKGYYRLKCVSNLKQVGLAFRIWEGDNNDHYPMGALTNQNGGPLYTDSTNQFRYFQIMSNELSNPRILLCPDDTNRIAATNFTRDFNGCHISYFIGLDATKETISQLFLAGDSHLTNGQPLNHGVMEVSPNRSAGWTKERHKGSGNVCMADGSVQQFDTPALNAALRQAGLTNHLLMPP